MTSDTGVICTICMGLDHRASSCPDRKKFRRNGRLVTLGLFLENYTPDTDSVMYSLSREDKTTVLCDRVTKGNLPSLYKLYMAMEDLTEYEFAITYFESWDHWQTIAKSVWMKEHLSKWRSELEIKLKSMAVKEMIKEATLGGRNAFQALRWIIDKGWIEKAQGPGRGRPSKDEIRAAALEAAFSDNQVKDDIKRLGIN